MTEKEILELPEDEFIDYVLQGNRDAIDFCQAIFRVSQVYDAIIDSDPFSKDDIHEAFWLALIELPLNRFYVDNFAQVHVLMRKAILDWRLSNKLEGMSDNRMKVVAYVLKSSVSHLLADIVAIAAGQEWYYEVAPVIMKYLYTEPIPVRHNSGKK